MVFSPVPSTSYPRTIRPIADGQPRRERHAGQLFNLQTRSANMEVSSSQDVSQRQQQAMLQGGSQSAQEKWLRLMGAARQVAYQAGELPVVPGEAGNQRYRLQRTYFDQERQVDPPLPTRSDYRLLAYQQAGAEDNDAAIVDFVI